MTRQSIVLAAAISLALAPDARAQVVPQPPQRPPAIPISGVLERRVRQRWIHEGQHPGFTVFDTVATAYRLSGSRRLTGRGQTRLGIRAGNVSATLTLDSTFRTTNALYDLPPIRYMSGSDEHMRAAFRRSRLTAAGGELPAALFWEVPFALPSQPLAPGVEWTDTMSYIADPGEGMTQRLSGVWRNRVVRDTVLDGRPLPLVRVEADVRYGEREVVTDFTMDDPFVIERDVVGTIVGFAVVDTALGIRVAGADTSDWRGVGVLHSSDGGAWQSGIRFERRRTWEYYDSVGWLAHRDSAREAERRTRTGMLVLPRTRLEERLRAGDVALADSLFARWTETGDPNERARIQAQMIRWPARGDRPAIEARFMAARLAAGDSVSRIEWMIDQLGYPRLPPERLDSLLPYLNDTGRLWRLGIVPVEMHMLVADRMLLRSTPLIEPDSARWRCAPEVCRRISALVDAADETRLRDAALVGAFARDPARWWTRVVARSEAGSRIARLAVDIADGLVETPSGAQQPIPALHALNALPEPTAEQLAAEFESGSAARVRIAQTQLAPLMTRYGERAPEALTAELLGAALDSAMTDAAAPWPWLDAAVPEGQLARMLDAGLIQLPGGRLFLRTDSLPTSVIARARQPIEPISAAEWDARPERAGGTIMTISDVRVWGRFARFSWGFTTFSERGGDEAPAGYARGASVTLLRTADGWRIVGRSVWYT